MSDKGKGGSDGRETGREKKGEKKNFRDVKLMA